MCSEGNSAVVRVSNYGDSVDLHHHKAIPRLDLKMLYHGVYGSTNPAVDLMSTSSLNKRVKEKEKGGKKKSLHVQNMHLHLVGC